jgi:hypothetical protein
MVRFGHVFVLEKDETVLLHWMCIRNHLVDFCKYFLCLRAALSDVLEVFIGQIKPVNFLSANLPASFSLCSALHYGDFTRA